jgi:streptomycin 6-kinase
MNLPPEFISNVQGVIQEDGRRYVDALPDLVVEASAQWGLTNVQPVPNLSYNFVAFANRGESQVMLKIGLPNRETRSEMAALRLFSGEGACKLLEYDEERYWMLLERLKPGVMLSTMEDDEEATRIAAEVMKRMWQPVGARHVVPLQQDKFIQLTDWFFGGFERMRKYFNGGTGPINAKLVERVERSVKDFFAENHNPVLMHGDFHHYNILSSQRGWLVIDPKGVIGPAGYEVGPLMINPWFEHSDGNKRKIQIKRRIDILHEHLGFERERILEWSLAHAIISAWWSIEDDTGYESTLQFAELLASF